MAQHVLGTHGHRGGHRVPGCSYRATLRKPCSSAPVTAGRYKCGRRGFLFFSARSPLRKLPSAPPPPPQSRPRNLATPETSSTHRRKTTGAAHHAQRRRSFIELLPSRVITMSFLFLRSWRTRGVYMPRETRMCFLWIYPHLSPLPSLSASRRSPV